MSVRRAIVIGAGLAGLNCARRLYQLGIPVQVLEKSRGVGGRAATRRVGMGADASPLTLPVDHGAQYISPKSEVFQTCVGKLVESGVMTEWTNRLHSLNDTGLHGEGNAIPRYVGVEGMTAIAKSLAADLDISPQTRVTTLRRKEAGWILETEDDRAFECDIAIVAIPAPQAADLLKSALEAGDISARDPAIAAVQAARYAACIAVMTGYPPATPTPDWKGITWRDDTAIAWTALDSSKRQNPDATTVVIHSTAEFARCSLDASRDELDSRGKQLVVRAAERLGAWIDSPEWMQVHRWRYAFPETVAEEQSLAIADGSLILAGDWCAGPRVESAFHSGLDAAERVLNALA